MSTYIVHNVIEEFSENEEMFETEMIWITFLAFLIIEDSGVVMYGKN